MNGLINFILYHTPFFYLIQSLWRDEAFSFFMSRPAVIKVIIYTANDFNPPLYYLFLHFWIYIAGQSDVNLRILSFIFHLIGTYYAYLLGRKFGDKNQAFYLSVFYLLNPMLLYYAFELRMYSLYGTLTMATVYYFYDKNWRNYVVSAVLGLYTHSFFVLIISAFAVYNLVQKKLRKNILKTLLPIIFFLPWIPVLAIQFAKSKQSWLFAVDAQLIKSVLGNLFTSYEGTPGGLWRFTALLSVIILVFIIIAYKNKKLKKSEIFLYPIFLPLILILVYSVIKRPLYVNRYLIFISVFEVISVFIGIISIKNKTFRRIAAIFWLLFVVAFNIFIAPFKKKADFQSAFSEINKTANNNDQVFARTPIGFLESAFYYKNEKNTFVYNPKNIHIPDYIGVNVVFPNISKSQFPQYPVKVFMINDDGSYEIVISKP